MYFNDKDELVSEVEASRDKKGRIHAVEVNFGSDDQEKLDRITKDIFTLGKGDREENARIFLDKLGEARKKRRVDAPNFNKVRECIVSEDELIYGDNFSHTKADKLNKSDQPEAQIQKTLKEDDENVLINMDPTNYERPRDHLFFDFFSIYTQNYVDEKKQKDSFSPDLVLKARPVHSNKL